MNLKRVWMLIKNEVVHGPKDVVLVMAIVMPVLLALFVNLAFGNIFTDRASLGVYDEGTSRLSAALGSAGSISLRTYQSESDLKAAAARGAVDMGIVLPADFDRTLASGTVRLKAYTWGESLAKDRAIVPITLANAIRDVTGSVLPVNIETVPLGDESSLPWNDRLLPLVVLMAIFFGGMMIPASSLIKEKGRHTLEALNVSPATIGDIFLAKASVGVFLATFMGVVTLAVGSRLNASSLVLVPVLGLGAVMAAEFGLLAGAFIKDMNTLFAFWKFGGLLLFGPAVVYMFPQIPGWIGYLFPTFYVIKPVIDLSVNGLGFNAVALNLAILLVIILVTAFAVSRIIGRLSTRALQLSG
jgi:ABC-2 type transport system permease protein